MNQKPALIEDPFLFQNCDAVSRNPIILQQWLPDFFGD